MDCLELGRAEVAQRRVETLVVIDLVEHASKIEADRSEVLIAASVPLLVFELANEALAKGVVVRVARTAHADLSAVLLEQSDIFAASRSADRAQPTTRRDQTSRITAR